MTYGLEGRCSIQLSYGQRVLLETAYIMPLSPACFNQQCVKLLHRLR